MQAEQHQPEPEKQPTEQQPEQKPSEQQPEQQRFTYTVSEDGVYTVQTKHGKFDLRIKGDTNKLLVIPIKHFYGIDAIVGDGVIQLNQPVQDEPLTATTLTSKPSRSRSHHVEAGNAELKAENERLRAEIEALKNAFNAQHD